MRVWRIYDHHAAYALQPNFDPLDGHGAALYPGRWNRQGVPMVYTSQSPELAMLELLTKVTPATFGVRMAVEIELPTQAKLEDAEPRVLESLLRGVEEDLRELGSAWAISGRSLALAVPSAVMPLSRNYLINPTHPHAKALRIVRQVPVSVDPRLLSATDLAAVEDE